METLKRIINNERIGYIIDCFGTTLPILQKLRYNNIGGYTALISEASIDALLLECRKHKGIVYMSKEDYDKLTDMYTDLANKLSEFTVEYITPVDLTEDNIGKFIKLSEKHEESYDIKYVPFTQHVYNKDIAPDTIKIGRLFNSMSEGKGLLLPVIGKPIMFYGNMPSSTTAYANSNYDFKYLNNHCKDDIIKMFEGTKKYRDIISQILDSEYSNNDDQHMYLELLSSGCSSTEAKLFVNRVKYIEDNNLMGELSILKRVYASMCKGAPLRLVDASGFSTKDIEDIIKASTECDILLMTISTTDTIKYFRYKYMQIITVDSGSFLESAGISNHYEDYIGYIIMGDEVVEFIIQ